MTIIDTINQCVTNQREAHIALLHAIAKGKGERLARVEYARRKGLTLEAVGMPR